MSRTQDIVLARVRMLVARWRMPALEPVGNEAPDAAVDDPDTVVDLDAVIVDEGRTPARLWLPLVGLLAVVVLLLGGAALLRSWPRPIAQPVADQAGEPAAVVPLEGFSSPSPAPSLVVHVAGDVRRPGVVSLPAGSRVADAVEAAGGLRKGGKLGATNLARQLTDGERVEIGEAAPGPLRQVALRPGPWVRRRSWTSTPRPAEQLDTLPGVGPVTASKILSWRAAHGRFTTVDELAEVPGIGPKTLEELRPHVRV